MKHLVQMCCGPQAWQLMTSSLLLGAEVTQASGADGPPKHCLRVPPSPR